MTTMVIVTTTLIPLISLCSLRYAHACLEAQSGPVVLGVRLRVHVGQLGRHGGDRCPFSLKPKPHETLRVSLPNHGLGTSNKASQHSERFMKAMRPLTLRYSAAIGTP